MDFPLFHFDFIGNRMLIAIIAITHVLINHTLAVGFLPLITLLEYFGFKQRDRDPEHYARWDELVRKMMFVGFIITTTAGALTGVGIWFSASLINPASIGSLIRVFYGAWFAEWIVFCLEVVFIMIYYLTWKKSNVSAKNKKRHIMFGAALSIFSGFTMLIIVAILGFMMDTGSWLTDKSFLSGVFNPIFLPQLYFRTPLSMTLAGAAALLLIGFFARNNKNIRREAIMYTSLWLLLWTPVTAAGAVAYYMAIPNAMTGSLPTAVGTIAFAQWYDQILMIIGIAVAVSFIVGLWGFLGPRTLPNVVLIVPILTFLVFLGTFERIREFIRKPFVVGEYMYANGLRTDDYALFKKEGVLAHSAYVDTPVITKDNKLRAGENVFNITCSRCHTVTGINSAITKFRDMSPDPENLDRKMIKDYIPRMHNVRYYMPEFPGTTEELGALAEFIVHQSNNPKYIEGVQSKGIEINPLHAVDDIKDIGRKK